MSINLTIFLQNWTIPDICHLDHLYIGGEIFCHVEKFQISIHDRCGEIRNLSTCRGISDFSTQQMWRNVKFCQIWRNFTFLRMADVKKYEICPVFCCKICYVAIYAVFYEIRFGAIYAFLRGGKLSQKVARWRKMTNIRYACGASPLYPPYTPPST